MRFFFLLLRRLLLFAGINERYAAAGIRVSRVAHARSRVLAADSRLRRYHREKDSDLTITRRKEPRALTTRVAYAVRWRPPKRTTANGGGKREGGLKVSRGQVDSRGWEKRNGKESWKREGNCRGGVARTRSASTRHPARERNADKPRRTLCAWRTECARDAEASGRFLVDVASSCSRPARNSEGEPPRTSREARDPSGFRVHRRAGVSPSHDARSR